MTDTTMVLTWEATGFDDALDDYFGAAAGAEAVAEWVQRAHAAALADALVAARDLLAAFDNAAALGDDAARAARKERIEDLSGRIAAYVAAGHRLREVERIAGIVVELRAEARALGRLADEAMNEAVAAAVARAATNDSEG
ncbi:MAG: hypothetical protein AMXMBFR53_41940 [Gemmatimonadota bacterium]